MASMVGTFLPVLAMVALYFSAAAALADFHVVGQTWTSTQYSNGTVRFSADKTGQSAIVSYHRYVHGVFTARMRLPAGDSAGMVSCFYLGSSANSKMPNSKRDELDMEFLGNTYPSGIILHTNYYAQGVGNHEEQFQLWFDPSADYHEYEFQWTWERVIWLVDGIPLRSLNRAAGQSGYKAPGFLYQPMAIISSIWDGSDWATDHGKIRANYDLSPFNVFVASVDLTQACRFRRPALPCAWSTKNRWDTPLTAAQLGQMAWYRSKYLLYTYTDPSHRKDSFPAIPSLV
eukprot:TRINITY_DN4873_c0_g1_i1.p1 TRINITY_DN4873_c0_g1~~TRINITY_DN4873_c0_g1_i1.p1  ORF type:complete len:288 (+),score=16.48 TRINITY_DN4873_c0_g1_i1:98-961(+)